MNVSTLRQTIVEMLRLHFPRPTIVNLLRLNLEADGEAERFLSDVEDEIVQRAIILKLAR